MKKVTSFEELVDLPLYEPLYIIQGITVLFYRKAGYYSDKKDIVVFSSEGNITNAIGVSKYTIQSGKTFIIGKYDSKFIGDFMVSYLSDQIESVKDTYL